MRSVTSLPTPPRGPVHRAAGRSTCSPWILAACLVAAGTAVPGLSSAAPAGTPAAMSDGNADARTVERLVRSLRQHTQDGIWMPTALRSLDDFRNLHRDIESQRPKAVTALVRAARAGQPEEAAARSALDALTRGDVMPAVTLLGRWEQAAPGRSNATRQAAELARHQGALLAGTDVEQALAAYQRAGRLEAGDTPTLLVINDLNSYLLASVPSAGLPAAPGKDPASDALAVGRARLQASVENGNEQLRARDAATALNTYREALRQAEQLVAGGAPGAVQDAGLQRDLSIVHNRIGDALGQLGQPTEALSAYRQGLALRERLAAAPGAGAQAQRDLVLSLNRVSELLGRQGQAAEAGRMLEQAVSTAQRLARQQPALLEAQRDLAASQERLGDLRLQAGQLDAARAALRPALELRQRTAESDPTNRIAQREWANSLDLSSELAQARKDLPAALQAVRQGLALRQTLAAARPDDLTTLRDLSISHNRLGDLRNLQGERAAAVQSYHEALRLRDALVAREPDQAQWQRDLSVSHTKLADTQVLQGDNEGALTSLRTALALRERLVARDATNSQWQGDLALALGKLSTVSSLPMPERQAYLERGQAIVERLKAGSRTGVQQNWSAWFDAQKRLLERPTLERAAPVTTAQAAAAQRLR